jgi:hypothetical protein
MTIHKCVPCREIEEAKDHGVRTANTCTTTRTAKAARNIRLHNKLDINIFKQAKYYKYYGPPCTALRKLPKKFHTINTIVLGLTLIGSTITIFVQKKKQIALPYEIHSKCEVLHLHIKVCPEWANWSGHNCDCLCVLSGRTGVATTVTVCVS